MKTSGCLCAALVGVAATVLAQDMANLNITDLSDIFASYKELVSASSKKESTTQQWSFEDLQDQEETVIQALTPAPRPAPTSDPGPFIPTWVIHSEVRPYPQPEPKTISEKVAIKFKPQLHISTGCHPYPAVNEAGEVGGGLKITGSRSSKCKGSGWGSQVYGRSAWHRDVWAIMYSWYFPKDSMSPIIGHRHDWENVIIWINDPALDNATILAVTPSAHAGYLRNVPPAESTVSGTSAKIKYESRWLHNHALDCTSDDGEVQDLIMWGQLSENTRRALNCVSWGKANVPMNDSNFKNKLEKAWPFKKKTMIEVL